MRTKYKIDKSYISFEKEMIARSFLVGLFIAFIPMPMQMMAVFFVAPFFKFNVPIAFLLCWITNPITMPFIYALEYSLGSYTLGYEVKDISFTIGEIGNILFPLYLGAFIVSSSLSLLGYFGIKLFVKNKI